MALVVTSRRTRCAAAIALAAGALVLVPTPSALAAPGPPSAEQWWFDTWDVPALWAGGARGQGITIAEIDTGVNADLPELAGKVLPGKDFGDASADGRTDQDVEEFGHGTAMASLMVAEPGVADITGLAPDAQILPIAVPLRGTVTVASRAVSIASAIRWAADNGGDIISMSLTYDRDPEVDAVPCLREEQEAITYAISRGAIVVAGSGNAGEDGSPVAAPGVCIGVVSVGAVDEDNEVAPFSSRHPYLTITAPGVRIPTLSRVPGDAYIGEGTSQATAIASASLALIWSAYPSLTNHEVVARLLATLERRVTTVSPDPAYGYGILDAGAAIRADVAVNAPNPLLDAILPFLDKVAAEREVALVPPAATSTTEAPPETVVTGVRPGPVTTPVLAGIGLGAGGAIALVLLTTVGVLRRRRVAAPPLPTRSVTVDADETVRPSQ